MSLTRDIDSDAAAARSPAASSRSPTTSAAASPPRGSRPAPSSTSLRSLGVNKVQGYFLSRPLALEAALDAARSGCPAFEPPGRVSLGS